MQKKTLDGTNKLFHGCIGYASLEAKEWWWKCRLCCGKVHTYSLILRQILTIPPCPKNPVCHWKSQLQGIEYLRLMTWEFYILEFVWTPIQLLMTNFWAKSEGFVCHLNWFKLDGQQINNVQIKVVRWCLLMMHIQHFPTNFLKVCVFLFSDRRNNFMAM